MKGTEKRAAILKATMELIREHGFHATPMSMIAKQAGVAAGTIYTYFPSKEVLITQLYGELKEKMSRAILENDPGTGNLRERFFGFYRNLFHYFVQNPEEFSFLEQYANSPFISQTAEEENQHFHPTIVAFLADGIEIGILRNLHIDLMTSLVHGHVVAVAKLQLSARLEINEERLQQSVQSCWDSVKIT